MIIDGIIWLYDGKHSVAIVSTTLKYLSKDFYALEVAQQKLEERGIDFKAMLEELNARAVDGEFETIIGAISKLIDREYEIELDAKPLVKIRKHTRIDANNRIVNKLFMTVLPPIIFLVDVNDIRNEFPFRDRFTLQPPYSYYIPTLIKPRIKEWWLSERGNVLKKIFKKEGF